MRRKLETYLSDQFPMETSQHIIGKLLNYIPTKNEVKYRILEPSAGTGRLARAVRSTRDASVAVCELNEENAKALMRDGFPLVGRDFLKYQLNRSIFDYVVAVPPYKDNEDVTHIRHMYDHCKVGGKVISLTLPYWTTGFFTIQREFRQWLQRKNYHIEFIEDESYVACPKAILVITK